MQERDISFRLIERLDECLADFRMLRVLPNNHRHIIDDVLRLLAFVAGGNRCAADGIHQIGAVCLNATDMETGVEVKCVFALIIKRRLIERVVVDRVCRRICLIHIRPELDAFNNIRIGQVCLAVFCQKGLAAAASPDIQEARCIHIVRAHRNRAAVNFAVLALRDRRRCRIELVPSRGNIKIVLFQQILAVPHHKCMRVDRYCIAAAIIGHFLNRRFIETVAANFVDHIIQRNDRVGVDHFDNLTGLRGTHVGDVARGEAGRPLGVEVCPGVGFNVDLNLGVFFHE